MKNKINYEAQHDEIMDVLQMVGPVKQFRLNFKEDTEKFKGDGFCEYTDPEYAVSAIRNLHKQVFKGRELRVSDASKDKTTIKKLEIETDEYQRALMVDESQMAAADIIKGCTAKQKLNILKQLRMLADEKPESCEALAKDKNMMDVLTTISPAFSNPIGKSINDNENTI